MEGPGGRCSRVRHGCKLPKLAPDTIRRERITTWLSDHADVPLRLVVGPVGFRARRPPRSRYAAAPRHRAGYVAPRRRAPRRKRFAPASRAPSASTEPADDEGADARVRRRRPLRGPGRRGRPRARGDARRAAPLHLRRARQRDVRLRVPARATSSTRRAWSRSASAPSSTATASRSRSKRRRASPKRRASTRPTSARSAGCCTIPKAGRSPCARRSANRRRPAVRSTARSIAGAAATRASCAGFIDDALADEEPVLADAARKLFDGEAVDDAMLDRLEQRGLFVRWIDGSYRPYRAVARATRAATQRRRRARCQPFSVRLFGKSDVRIEGQRVAWFRRRDAQLFAFLALQPQGRARRETLLRAFWPDADRQLAAQSLRSACSTMRRSLAAVVGYADLAHYVAFGGRDRAEPRPVRRSTPAAARAPARRATRRGKRGDIVTAAEHDRAALEAREAKSCSTATSPRRCTRCRSR